MRDIIGILIATAIAIAAWLLPGSLEEPASTPHGMLPCATEDAPGPCVWDADSWGNGEGQSFWVDSEGGVHYLP